MARLVHINELAIASYQHEVEAWRLAAESATDASEAAGRQGKGEGVQGPYRQARRREYHPAKGRAVGGSSAKWKRPWAVAR